MADSVSSLGYIGKSETKRFVKADKVESKSLVLSDQPTLIVRDASTGATGSVGSGPLTLVIFPTEDVKRGDIKYNSATGIVTIGSSGIYSLSAMIYFPAVPLQVGQRTVLIAVVGSQTTNPLVRQTQEAVSNASATVLSVSTGEVSLTAGDTIAVYVSQTSGAGCTINNAGPGRFSVSRVQ